MDALTNHYGSSSEDEAEELEGQGKGFETENQKSKVQDS